MSTIRKQVNLITSYPTKGKTQLSVQSVIRLLGRTILQDGGVDHCQDVHEAVQ